LEVITPIGDQGVVGLFVEDAVRGLAQPASPKWLAFPLEARTENRGVHGVRKAVAHLGGTFIFDVHVEFADAWRQQEVHDGAIIRKLSSRERYLIRAFRIELLQPSTSFI
jgi:hypothetical protein